MTFSSIQFMQFRQYALQKKKFLLKNEFSAEFLTVDDRWSLERLFQNSE